MPHGSPSGSSSSFHFIAGLGSGVTSACLLQPADLLKTRVQQIGATSLGVTFRSIYQGPHPVRQLWRGTLPSALRTGIGSALYFTTLNFLRQYVARSSVFASSGLMAPAINASKKTSSSLPKVSDLANLTTGAVARASVGFVLMPLTVLKVRYESSLYSYKSIWGAGTAIWSTEGIRGFFAGFGATAARDAPFAGLYVLFYEQLKHRLSEVRAVTPLTSERVSLNDSMKGSTSASINFVSSVAAAGMATTVTNPFDAVKTRLQLMPGRYGNMIAAGRRMVREDGFRSLFGGLGLRIGRKALSSALAWTLYEELIRRADSQGKEENRSVLGLRLN